MPTDHEISTASNVRPADSRPQSQRSFLVFAGPLAAHLANLGYVVEQVVLKDNNRIGWRVPLAARADADRYGETLKRLDNAKRLTQCQLIGGVYTGQKERVR